MDYKGKGKRKMYQKGRAWIELNMDNLIHNVSQFRRLLPSDCAIMPAIKANAYGHGADIIGLALQNSGITDYCVASADEGIELRRIGITGQILILGYTSPYQFPDLVKYSLTQTAVDSLYARQLNDYGKMINVHVGIDTGMRRLGECSDNIGAICNIWKRKNLRITGVFSHLCVADGQSDEDRKFTTKQIERFDYVVDSLHRRGIDGFRTHLQSSYGVLNYPFLKYDYARLGIALYGVLSNPHDKVVSRINLKPVLSLKARIMSVRSLHKGESVGYGLTYTAKQEMKIATVSIGFADGIPRELSNKGCALVNGHEVPIIGRICMDQLMIDVSDIPKIASGDEAVFIGQSGKKEIVAGELAEKANTITNEILSRMGSRLNRVIHDESGIRYLTMEKT